MPFAGGLLDQPAVWRRKFQRFLPYVIDQHIVRQLNARYSKEWEPTPWPGDEQPATEPKTSHLPKSVQNALANLKSFSGRIAALRARTPR